MIVFLLTWVTSGQNHQQSSYCKIKNPTSSDAQLECWMTKICPSRDRWFVASLFFARRRPPAANTDNEEPCRNPEVNHRPLFKICDHRRVASQFWTTPRSAKRHEKLKYTVNLQQKYAKKKTTKKIKKQSRDVFSFKRGQAQRTACSWGQMGHSALIDPMLEVVALFFQSGLHLFLPPSYRLGGKQLQIS